MTGLGSACGNHAALPPPLASGVLKGVDQRLVYRHLLTTSPRTFGGLAQVLPRVGDRLRQTLFHHRRDRIPDALARPRQPRPGPTLVQTASDVRPRSQILPGRTGDATDCPMRVREECSERR